jgi:hypothetical protein
MEILVNRLLFFRCGCISALSAWAQPPTQNYVLGFSQFQIAADLTNSIAFLF